MSFGFTISDVFVRDGVQYKVEDYTNKSVEAPDNACYYTAMECTMTFRSCDGKGTKYVSTGIGRMRADATQDAFQTALKDSFVCVTR